MKKVVMLCFALTTFVVAHSQSRQLKINLDSAIEIALTDNPTIKVANMEIERQEYVRKETTGNLLPSFGVNGQYSRNIKKSEMGGMSFQGDNSLSAQASLSLPLFVPGVYQTLKMNKQQMFAAVESARGSRLVLINEVKKAYYGILMSEQSLEVLMITKENIEETVRSTQSMFDNGLTSEYNLITAEVQLSNMQPDILQMESSIEVSKLYLKMLLSLPEDVDVSLEGNLDEYKNMIISTGTDLSVDISSNSELKGIEIQERILNSQFKVLRTQRMPTVAAFGNYSLSGEEVPGFFGTAPSDGLVWQKPMAIGLQLSVPIFSGFTKANRERQLKNNIAQLALQREYLEQGKIVEVNTVINYLFTAREQMFANEKAVILAVKANSISKTRYSAGAGTILELNSSVMSLTVAQLNYTQSIYDYLVSQAEYEKIIGKEK